MAIVLKFSRPDCDTQWGFRLVGGADFETPLVVIKVYENSLAQQTGLEEGDVIVRINETATAGLTHAQSHDLLSHVGNEFEMGVRRGDILFYQQWVNDIENNVEVSEILKNMIQNEDQHKSGLQNIIMEVENPETIREKSPRLEKHVPLPEKPTEMEEKLKQVITDPLNKKWSTFLQRPEKPVPVPKKVEEQRKIEGEPYRVVIKKQKKKTPFSKKVEFDEEETVIEAAEINTEISAEELEQERLTSEIEVEVMVTEKEEVDVYVEEGSVGEEEKLEIEEIEETLTNIETESVTEISMSLEEQLRQVQKQLQALSQLPSAIQTTLDAVSQQLAQIVTVRRESEDQGIVDEKNEDLEDDASLPDKTEADITEDNDENLSQIEEDVEEKHGEEDEHKEAGIKVEETVEENKLTEEQEEAIRMEQEKVAKKNKEMELRPIQRPIILPGGRKWAEPDDACPSVRNPKMTDEKIATTIETFSEVIVGKTKGINFLKYQPPPKNMDYLQRSEVYRLVHDMETPVRGISTRVEKILAEQDYVVSDEAQN